ncbi:ATP-binding cassette domain-containing protein [Vagococcus zengguangii]|uniref:ABC transporter ATP-binding protein n=1 Tax=Vagococcus zengguangii TaxID=2571750 RepID=A0A4D7CYQ4_9ENTE|nr:ABC transporter ATP-binding protein [Vagococcus zengguangii]QCI86796.1 ABC transporter ATP-binding protein [Vagococcus zengguangii]TLG80402.1 ABC transporter ATP-binding protein [Vagococcus zengguangii]
MLIIKYGKKREWLLCLALFLVVSFQGLMMAYIVSGFTTAATQQDSQLFKRVLIVGITLLTLFAVVNYLSKLSKIKLIKSINQSLRSRVMSVYLNSNDKALSKEGLAFLTNDLKQLETNALQVELMAITCLFTVVISVFGALLFDVRMTIVFFIGSLLPLIIGKLTKRKITKASAEWQRTNQQYVRMVKDTLDGLTTIKTYQTIQPMERRATVATNQLENKLATMNKIVSLSDTFVYLVSWISGMMLPFAVGIYLVIEGQLSLGIFMGVLQLSNNFVNPLIQMMQLKNQKATTDAIIENLEVILATENTSSLNEFEPQEHIKFDSLELSGAIVSDGQHVLMPSTNLKVKENEKILITAPSGYGKSTLLKVLQGHHELSTGKYFINNQIVKKLSQLELQRYFAYVQQTPYIFNSSILFNVTLGEDYSDEALEHVIEQVGLADVVAEKGWDYLLGEGQGDLSGGQIQRLEIARALLRKRPVLLIDEGTSALDKQTSLTIRDIINAYPGTVIEVGHKLSTEEQRGFDRVIPLDKQAREAS